MCYEKEKEKNKKEFLKQYSGWNENSIQRLKIKAKGITREEQNKTEGKKMKDDIERPTTMNFSKREQKRRKVENYV